ncbi:MAG: TRAP transporter small permease [Alphaproteobacteria bacterium]|nr:MAG: TRAP transporter small permease [Alphaproteobacteria bacterium]
MTAGLPRLLSGADRVIGTLAMAFNICGTLLIVWLAILVNADILGRELFGAPVSGVPEMVSLSIVAIVFLQVAQSMRAGRMIRAEAVANLMPRRARAGLFALYDLAGAALIGVLIGASWPIFLRAWERGTYVGAVGDFTAPEWPVKLIIILGSAVLLAQFLLSALANLLTALGRGGAP